MYVLFEEFCWQLKVNMKLNQIKMPSPVLSYHFERQDMIFMPLDINDFSFILEEPAHYFQTLINPLGILKRITVIVSTILLFINHLTVYVAFPCFSIHLLFFNLKLTPFLLLKQSYSTRLCRGGSRISCRGGSRTFPKVTIVTVFKQSATIGSRRA